jgi:cell division septation protein DedD
MYKELYSRDNDEYLDEFRQKVAKQKIASMEERRSELVRSRNNFLGTFAGIALAGVVAWFILAPQYAEHSKELVVLRRPQTAVKIKPENPGGMEIPNQDKDVYNIVEKKNVDNTVVENLLPMPEQPKLPEIAPEVTDIDENATNLDEIVEEVSQPTEEVTAPKEVVENNMPAKPSDLLADSAQDAAKEVKTAAAQTADATKEKAAEVVTLAKETVAAATPKVEPKAAEPVVATVANGKWQMQLVASKNKAAVEQTWTTLSGKYADLAKYSHEVQTSDLGAQGIFYRLRAGSFATREDAAKACAALKAKGLADCIVKER